MSERGVYAVDRGLFDHPDFANEPFTEREAWSWLIGSCAWEPKRVRVGNSVVDIDRGQCAFSLRFMATRWQWSEPRVRRFLNRAKTDARAIVDATQGTTRITICNYDKYQFGRRSDVLSNDAQTDAAPTQHRRKEEELKELKKEEKKDTRAVAVAPRPTVADPFDEFWKAYPRRDGANPKAPARKLFLAALKGGADAPAIIEGARRCAIVEHEKIGTPYIPQAVKWLRDRRWEDYAAGPPAANDLSDEERQRLFEQMRNGSEHPEGKNLRGTGDGPRAIEGNGRQEPTGPPNDKTRRSGMERLGGLFPGTSGFCAGGDETSDGGTEPGNDSTRPLARPV